MAHIDLELSSTGIVASNPDQGMDTCPRFYVVLSRVVRFIAMS